MGVLNREAILAAEDLPIEQISVPEWGGEVRIRTLTGHERDAFEESLVRGEGDERKRSLDNLRAKLAVITVVDENGSRIFSDDDAKRLGEKSSAALDRVFIVANRLSGFTDAAIKALEGNSKPGQNGGSTSSSPSVSE